MARSKPCFAKINLVIKRDEPILPFIEALLHLPWSMEYWRAWYTYSLILLQGGQINQLDQWDHFIPVAGSGRGFWLDFSLFQCFNSIRFFSLLLFLCWDFVIFFICFKIIIARWSIFPMPQSLLVIPCGQKGFPRPLDMPLGNWVTLGLWNRAFILFCCAELPCQLASCSISATFAQGWWWWQLPGLPFVIGWKCW